MAQPLDRFRRLLREPATTSQDAMVPVKVGRVVDTKKATAHWRQLLDKVFQVQQLVGLEESVQSWMPTMVEVGGAQQPSFQLSPEQLGEYIKDAESMPALKSKVTPVKAMADCQHPCGRLVRGGNQFAAWVSCQDCHARWRAPGHLRPGESKKKKKEESSASSSAQDKFDKEKLSLELKNKYSEMMIQQKATLMLEVEQRRYAEEQMIRGLRQEASQREATLKELNMMVRTARSREEIQELMMDEFATMAMGSKYTEHKGYHHGEMWAYAERKLAFEEEMKELEAQVEACNRTQEEMRENVTATASMSAGTRKVRKESMSKSPSPRVRRRGSR